MKETWILGVYIQDRTTDVRPVQSVLTKFGCSIKTRLGLHDINPDQPSSAGIMILELTGDPGEFSKLEHELGNIEGVEVQKMVFIQG